MFNDAKSIFSSIITALVVAVFAYGLHSCDVSKIKDANEKAVKKATDQCTADKKTLNDQCLADKLLTNGVSNDFQGGLSIRDRDLADSMRGSSPTDCFAIPGVAPFASGSDAAHQPVQPDKGGAVPRSAYLNFAAECETDRLKVIGLQNFIRKTWFSRGQ